MERAIKNGESVGNLFISLSGALKCYKHYLNNYDVASALLTWTQKPQLTNIFTFPPKPTNSAINFEVSNLVIKKLTAFISNVQKDPRHTQLNLFSYLLMPVQRIPRYKMLLESLLKHTPEEHEDHKQISAALKLISTMVDSCNEAKRSWENELAQMGVLSTINFHKQSVNTALILNPPIGRKFLRSSLPGQFRLVKFVEAQPLLKPTMIATRKSIVRTVYECVEYRFKPCELPVSAGEVYMNCFAHWDISRTSGKRITIHLFNDMLLICNCDDLIVCLAVCHDISLEHVALVGSEGAMRICDGYNVVYLRGQIEDLKAWSVSIGAFSQ